MIIHQLSLVLRVFDVTNFEPLEKCSFQSENINLKFNEKIGGYYVLLNSRSQNFELVVNKKKYISHKIKINISKLDIDKTVNVFMLPDDAGLKNSIESQMIKKIDSKNEIEMSMIDRGYFLSKDYTKKDDKLYVFSENKIVVNEMAIENKNEYIYIKIKKIEIVDNYYELIFKDEIGIELFKLSKIYCVIDKKYI